MNNWSFEKHLACPRCKLQINPKKKKGRCPCGFNYSKIEGIWNLLFLNRKLLKSSKTAYEAIHLRKSGRVSDGSYEILASFARGNRTIDIACGDGFIEKLAPESVGVEFSLNAIKKARRNGARNLVLASAESLPFLDNSFDLAICTGSLEHFADPLKALREMKRVSKVQILTVHKKFPLPFANSIRSLILKTRSIPDQPIEKPFSWNCLEQLLNKSKLKIVFKGLWTYPYNLDFLGMKTPRFLKIPSSFFVITVNTSGVWV